MKEIAKAATVFVNGPAGVFENEIFEKETKEIRQAIASAPDYTVIAAMENAGKKWK